MSSVMLPDDPSAHHDLGMALGLTDDIAGAIAAFRRAVDLAPDFTEAQNNLAVALQIERSSR